MRTLSLMTCSTMTLSTMTFSIMSLFATFSINDTRHYGAQHKRIECQLRFEECRIFIVILSVIVLNVVMLSVLMLSVVPLKFMT